MRRLDVYFNNTKAGVLTERAPGKDYEFCYDQAYLNSALPPVSLTLPKRKETYLSQTLFPFFSNLIPEGANRRVICRSLKIDEKDLFAILSAMAGKDFIGAVNLKCHESE
ncbi:MAG: HipA N-terminal domain-containing protein [Prevotellaceae bacterium]|nr:HipA N-terminal domain-containing protein [Prevotellaceae bacterium]